MTPGDCNQPNSDRGEKPVWPMTWFLHPINDAFFFSFFKSGKPLQIKWDTTAMCGPSLHPDSNNSRKSEKTEHGLGIT